MNKPMQMLVRNRVRDYERWRAVFDADITRGQAAGLTLSTMWRGVDEPENVFFILDVEDRSRAEAFLASPESSEAGADSGVIDGEYSFIEQVY